MMVPEVNLLGSPIRVPIRSPRMSSNRLANTSSAPSGQVGHFVRRSFPI